MSRFERERLGRCDFLDVLEESVLMHVDVEVELAGGETFVDRLRDVRTESGVDYAVFLEHPRVEVASIAAVTRRSLPHTYPA
ncbi:hypothetical protein [Vulgatibacter incomptus]|uniref:Uncharacterized protein n=1 Tax=Vulgatibacter incomptus TaxID=1391653 RepID=A0A0K1PGG7_9BACT|nr:hypothetical protein [Vulgatibacter incomptus]AKU92199.1 hypothetical protein AKJ08_2586 [Vulgatibacter incomptus]